MSFQHYVTGSNDDNFGLLASKYGVSWTDIARESGYTTSADFIYDWLGSHGGTRQSRDASSPNGYMWSFTPGMVLNIPGNGPSQSPVQAGAVPGGPGVVIVLSPDGSTPVVEDSDTDHDTVVGPSQATAGGGIMNILLAGVAVGAVLYLFNGDKKKGKKTVKTRRRPAKRRSTRRKSRR